MTHKGYGAILEWLCSDPEGSAVLDASRLPVTPASATKGLPPPVTTAGSSSSSTGPGSPRGPFRIRPVKRTPAQLPQLSRPIERNTTVLFQFACQPVDHRAQFVVTGNRSPYSIQEVQSRRYSLSWTWRTDSSLLFLEREASIRESGGPSPARTTASDSSSGIMPATKSMNALTLAGTWLRLG